MTFYLLGLNKTIPLKDELKDDGIVVFQSTTLDLKATSVSDNTALNLIDSAGNIILHISIRRQAGTIVFNTKPANGGWANEDVIQLQNRFVGPSITVAVISHPDRFQVLFDYHTVHYFIKRSKANAKSVAYGINAGQTNLLSETLGVTTYSSLAQVFSGGN